MARRKASVALCMGAVISPILGLMIPAFAVLGALCALLCLVTGAAQLSE